MNRIDHPAYKFDREPPGGEEEDYPENNVRGNVRNRNYYTPFYSEDLNRRYVTKYLSVALQQNPIVGHHMWGFNLLEAKVVNDQNDVYKGRAVVYQDLYLSASFRLPSEIFWTSVSDLQTTHGAEGIDIFTCIVVDHYWQLGKIFDIGDVFELQADQFINPTFPLRNPDPAKLNKYEVLAYDINSIKASDLWSYSVASTVYASSEEPVPVYQHMAMQVRHDIDTHVRFALKDMNLLATLITVSGAGINRMPQDKQIYFCGWIRDPRHDTHVKLHIMTVDFAMHLFLDTMDP